MDGSAQAMVPVKPVCPKLAMETQPHVGPSFPNWGLSKPNPLLFPSAQKSLVEYFTKSLIEFHQKPHSLVISTHSPYILTAFDNLIQAGNVFKQKPELKAQINKIISQKSWIDFDKVAAYYVENGKITTILNKSNKIIDANKIDKVSEEIAIDFDQLLDLRFSK